MNREEEEEGTKLTDIHWITDYKTCEANYNIFYKSDVITIKLIFYYMLRSGNNKITYKREEEEIKLNDKIDEVGYLKKIIPYETLHALIEEKSIKNNEKYKLKAMYKYNFLIETEQIIDNTDITNDNIKNDIYFSKVIWNNSKKKDIVFEKTIGFFQELNALYIIYEVENS